MVAILRSSTTSLNVCLRRQGSSNCCFVATPACTRYIPARRWRSDASSRQVIVEPVAPYEGWEPWVTKITLNRPKANAMGLIMLEQLQACLSKLEETDSTTRCVVLTSCSDRVFSAGADLKERATMSQEQAADFVTNLRNTMDRLAKLPVPVVAAVEGVAVGGGLELVLAADLRIASVNATMGLPETSLAIIPGAGGTQRLSRLIGVARAKELIWTGRQISATEAYAFGLVQAVVDQGQATNKALELAWEFCKNGPVAIRASKDAIDRGITASNMTEALEIERECYARVLPTHDRLEGLAAFKEGRTPNYKGD
jgi:enoyl-CoA hydratase/carnithine racemase